jgi:Tfp pilus assembly ATPase PilU
MSEITTTPQSKNELIITDLDLNTVEELLTEGLTLTEIFTNQKVLPITLHKFYSYLRKPENKEIKARIDEARRQGVQTLVDKLLQIYNTNLDDKTLDPAVVVWTRDRAAMVKWVASKISDIYSDKPKDINVNKQTSIVVSWLDSPELEQKYATYSTNDTKPEIIDQ